MKATAASRGAMVILGKARVHAGASSSPALRFGHLRRTAGVECQFTALKLRVPSGNGRRGGRMKDLGREIRSFRLDGREYGALALFLLMVLGVVVAAGGPDPRVSGGLAPGLLLLMGAAAWVDVARTAVRVHEHGIEVRGMFGTRSARWSEIRYVRFYQMKGAPLLKLEIPDTKPIFVPICLRHWPEFVATLEQHAGPEHDITLQARYMGELGYGR